MDDNGLIIMTIQLLIISEIAMSYALYKSKKTG